MISLIYVGSSTSFAKKIIQGGVYDHGQLHYPAFALRMKKCKYKCRMSGVALRANFTLGSKSHLC